MCVYVCIGGRDTLKLSDFIAETCVRTFLEDSTAALPSPRLHIESTFGRCLAKRARSCSIESAVMHVIL